MFYIVLFALEHYCVLENKGQLRNDDLCRSVVTSQQSARRTKGVRTPSGASRRKSGAAASAATRFRYSTASDTANAANTANTPQTRHIPTNLYLLYVIYCHKSFASIPL